MSLCSLLTRYRHTHLYNKWGNNFKLQSKQCNPVIVTLQIIFKSVIKVLLVLMSRTIARSTPSANCAGRLVDSSTVCPRAPPWSSGSVLDHRSLPPVFESRRGHIWRLFRLWLRLITFGGRSADLAYLVHKSGRKTSIIINRASKI